MHHKKCTGKPKVRGVSVWCTDPGLLVPMHHKLSLLNFHRFVHLCNVWMHQVRTLVFDNGQKYTQPLRPDLSCGMVSDYSKLQSTNLKVT